MLATGGDFDCSRLVSVINFVLGGCTGVVDFVFVSGEPSGPISTFFENFVLLLEELDANNSELIIVGDFNIHMDNVDSPESQNFRQILDSFGLKLRVSGPTHIAGHTLDLVITRRDSSIVEKVHVDDIISDHMMLRFGLMLPLKTRETTIVKRRSFKNFDIELFNSDLEKSELCTNPKQDINNLVNQYNSTLISLLDKHAPVTEKVINKNLKTPWYTNDIHTERQKRRRLTRKWRKSQSPEDKDRMLRQRDKVSNMIHAAKSDHYLNAITNAGKDSKALFQTFRQLLSDKKVNPMPPRKSQEQNANDFNQFFVDKITRLKARFDEPSNYSLLDGNDIVQTLVEFQPINLEETKRLISSAPSKTCLLDPVPTSVIKLAASSLSPVIQKIINLSLVNSTVPSNYKTAIVKPLLKKPDLDLVHKNYRPVSNLAFVSKLIEQAVIDQLEKHFVANDLNDEFQSAYRQNHSTETALLHITNDILMAMDNRRAVCMVMLDLSAAFDTINHDIMIERLRSSQGLGQHAAKWFESYLRGRTQRVSIDDYTSDHLQLHDGAVQGSKMGCRLYKKYVEPLGKMLKRSDCSYHGYADDNSIWKSINPKSTDSIESGLKSLDNTIQHTRSWMFANKLCLNDSKTEFIVFGLKRHTKEMPNSSIKIGEETIHAVEVVKNLGVMLDMQLDFRIHISNVVKGCRYHIRRAWQIRRFLNEEAANRIMLATVMCRLDYCNSILVNLPKKDIERLQKVQNAAARLVTLTPKAQSVKPVLKRLHWLPVAYRIKYKVAVVVHRCIYGTAPGYLRDLLTLYVPKRKLRSSTELNLVVPKVNQKTVGSRAFASAGPQIWNELPTSIRAIESNNIFKTKLKTYLFERAF